MAGKALLYGVFFPLSWDTSFVPVGTAWVYARNSINRAIAAQQEHGPLRLVRSGGADSIYLKEKAERWNEPFGQGIDQYTVFRE